nr:Spy/CpxP family protein refolding chaperone [Capillibacterium thermochitinicola]
MTTTAALAAGWGMGFGGGIGVACGLPGAQGIQWRNLDLTPEQSEKILTIRQEFAKDTLELRQQLQRAQLELHQLWAAENPDQTAINQKLAAMTPLRLELKKKIQEAQKQIESILTPEQLEQYNNFRPFTPGGRGRFRPRGWW